VVALGLLIVAPPFALQVHRGHQGGVAPLARFTALHLVKVVGTPFDGRDGGLTAARVLGAAAVVCAVGLLASPVGRPVPSRSLIVAASTLPVLFVAGLTVAADVVDQRTYDILISRYTAVAAPFMVVAIAVALVRTPPAPAAGLAAAVLVAAAVGMVASYRRSNFYPDLRDPFALITRAYQSPDVVELSGYPASHRAGEYYVTRLLRQRPRAIVVGAPPGQVASPPPLAPARVWIVTDPVTAPRRVTRNALVALGYRVLGLHVFVPSTELEVGIDARTATSR
jgi:hypothetical protein